MRSIIGAIVLDSSLSGKPSHQVPSTHISDEKYIQIRITAKYSESI